MTEFLKFVRCGTCLAVVLTLGGCVSYKGQEERDAHTRDFMKKLDERGGVVATNELSLADCIAIAMIENYDVQLADLNIKLAKFGKSTTFAQFLPQVSVGGSATSWDKQPMGQEKNYRTANVSLNMPLIVPSVWFMYASQGERVAQSKAQAHYVRQNICLQTMVEYYNCLVAADQVNALKKQVETAREMEKRVLGLLDEGLVRDWEAAQATAQRIARESELSASERNYVNRKSQMLNYLGLPPESDDFQLVLNGDVGEMVTDERDVEELILTALSVHPELEIADREVVAKENDVRKAIADFLPTLSGFGTASWTSDASSWTANRSIGLQGAWDAFTGFANVNLYRAAKVERTKAMLSREQTFLRIMLDVLVARNAVDDAAEQATVLAKVYDAAKMKFEDYDSRQREGLIPLSDALDAQSAMSAAEVDMLQSQYQERVAWVALRQAMGIIETGFENQENK